MKCLWVIRSVKAFTYGSNQRRVQLFHTLTSFHIGCELVQRIHSNGSCVTDKLCVQRPSAAAVLLLLARACVWEMSLNQDFRIKLGLIVIFFFFSKASELWSKPHSLSGLSTEATKLSKTEKKRRGVKNRDHCYVKRYGTLRKKQLYTVQGAECTVPTCWGRGCPAWTASSCEGWRRGGGGGEQGYVPVQVAYMKAMIVISTEINSKV